MNLKRLPRLKLARLSWLLGACVLAGTAPAADETNLLRPPRSALGPASPTTPASSEETNLLRPPRPVLAPSWWEQGGRWTLPVSLAVLAAVALALRLRRRSSQAAPPAPAAVARQALQALQGRAEDEALALEVSRLLRRYAIDALALPHAELTTAELEVWCSPLGCLGAAAKMAAPQELEAVLRDQPRLRPELATALITLLRECDVKKFAPVKPPGPQGLVARALELVDRIEAERQPPSAASP